MGKKIIMIVGDWYYPKMVYSSLTSEFNIDKIIVDNGESASKIIKRRIKRLGYLEVLGQVLFRLIVVTYINKNSKNRIKNILETNNIKESNFDSDKIIKVDSMNSDKGRQILKDLSPDIVVIVTTRILSKKNFKLN